MSERNSRGRPLAFADPEELRLLCDKYFKSITRTIPKRERTIVAYEDNDPKKPIFEDNIVLNDAGEQYLETEWLEPPSIVGLALYLGVDRQTLLNYKNKDEYFGTLRDAKTRIERYEAARLVTVSNSKGIEFSLANNHNWKASQTIDINHSQALPTYDISRMSIEDKQRLLNLIGMTVDEPDGSFEVPYLIEE